MLDIGEVLAQVPLAMADTLLGVALVNPPCFAIVEALRSFLASPKRLEHL